MHCTGQTSTHARSFTSIHASVMIASPDICYASSAHGRRRCVNARHRPISSTTAVTGVVAHDLSVRGRVPGGSHSLKWTKGSDPETWRRPAARPRSALASVLFRILALPSRYDSAVRCTIRRVVVLQFEGLTRIALVALAAAVLGLDQQTLAHHRHRNRSYGGYCTATLNALTYGGWPIRERTRSHHLSRLMHSLGARARLSSWPSRSWMWK